MSRLLVQVRRSTLPILIVLCVTALSVSYAFADNSLIPLATQIIGDPDAAVTGKLAVGTATPGNKALTVVGVIDFLGSGTVHNYFTEGTGNNMQINTNVDEANAIGDTSKSQWKLVLGSSLDWFSIRRSPAGGTYNEDALFFIQGSTGNVGIATVDTSNGATIPFTPMARLHVQTASGDAIWGVASASTGSVVGVYGRSESTTSSGVYGYAGATTGNTYGVMGRSQSDSGVGVGGWAGATTGQATGALGASYSTSGYGVFGEALSSTGTNFGVYGQSASTSGYGVSGFASATTGYTYGVAGESDSTSGTGVIGVVLATTGGTQGVYGQSASTAGIGTLGYAYATTGTSCGVAGFSDSVAGYGVYGEADSTTGVNYGVYGKSDSAAGYGLYSQGNTRVAGNFSVTGSKSAIVDTRDFGWRSLYAMESPQNWFEDFGQANLTAGETVVTIEEVFAETVNLDKPYRVFLTPLGEGCTLYVVDKSPTSFTVRANEGAGCEIAFDYRIIAARLDYEDLRLKEAKAPEAFAAGLPAASALQLPEEAGLPVSRAPIQAR